MERILLTVGIYLLAVQPSFAQSVGPSLSGRGFVILLVVLGGAYWGLHYYFENRRPRGETGFQLSLPVWFVLCVFAGVAGNILWAMWTFTFEPGFYTWAGPMAFFYFTFAWLVPLFVMATVQMFQTPSPSFNEAHYRALLPTVGGYYLTMLFMNEIDRALGLRP